MTVVLPNALWARRRARTGRPRPGNPGCQYARPAVLPYPSRPGLERPQEADIFDHRREPCFGARGARRALRQSNLEFRAHLRRPDVEFERILRPRFAILAKPHGAVPAIA